MIIVLFLILFGFAAYFISKYLFGMAGVGFMLAGVLPTMKFIPSMQEAAMWGAGGLAALVTKSFPLVILHTIALPLMVRAKGGGLTTKNMTLLGVHFLVAALVQYVSKSMMTTQAQKVKKRRRRFQRFPSSSRSRYHRVRASL